MINRIDLKFRQLKRDRKKAFIAYLTCGYPNISLTEKLTLELDKRGADIIELGVPFSDPLADGPTIQESSSYALKKGINLTQILSLVRRVRKKSRVPLCIMSYYNPIFSYGEERFVRDALKSGLDGIIIPDLIPEEARGLIKPAGRAKIAVIFFLSPTSSLARIKYISKISKGFIYYVSLTGVTGAKRDLPSDLSSHLKLIKKYTPKPLCVGFGISTPVQVRDISRYADGVIVGSAFIKIIRDNIRSKSLINKVGDLASTLMRIRM